MKTQEFVYFRPYSDLVSRQKACGQLEQHRQMSEKPFQNSGFNRQQMVNVYEVDKPIWDHLYQEGRKAQQRISEAHQGTKWRLDTECTFQPNIIHSKRYMAHNSSNFMERMFLWQDNKIEKVVREKEQDVQKRLKECTFQPKSNRKSQMLARNRSTYNRHKRHCGTQIEKPKFVFSQVDYSPHRIEAQQSSPRKQVLQLSRAKMIIRNELRRMAL